MTIEPHLTSNPLHLPTSLRALASLHSGFTALRLPEAEVKPSKTLSEAETLPPFSPVIDYSNHVFKTLSCIKEIKCTVN